MSSKRRRLMFSCTLCRERKLRCGREHPSCARCVKAGRDDDCKYVAYKDDELSQPATSPVPVISSHASGNPAFEWVEEMELYTKAANDNLNLAPPEPPGVHHPSSSSRIVASEPLGAHQQVPLTTKRIRNDESMGTPEQDQFTSNLITRQRTFLKGNDFKVRYFGPSHWTSIFLNFVDLCAYVRDTLKEFTPFLRKAKNIRDALKTAGQTHFQNRVEAWAQTEDLLSAFPDRDSLDRMVKNYLSTFETTYRVLHVPSFQKQYQEFLQDSSKSSKQFQIILLLLLATVVSLQPHDRMRYIGRGSEAQQQALEWIHICEKWLQAQSFKHTSLEYYQIRILLCVAKRVNTSKTKRGWLNAGDLIRHGIIAGMHREPSTSAHKMSIFDQEMRRRLWATMMELELSACIDQGIRPSITVDDWDTRPPSNIDDEDLTSTCTKLPTSKPLNEFTRMSFLRVCSETFAKRLSLVATVNKIKSELTWAEAAGHNRFVHEHLSTIPSWQDNSADRSASNYAHTLIRLQAYELCLILSQQIAASRIENEDYMLPARTAFTEAAAATLELQQSLPDIESLLVSSLHTYTPRASLCLCLEIVKAIKSSIFTSSVSFNQTRAIQLLENAVEQQHRKIYHLGADAQPYCMMSCALGLIQEQIQAKGKPDGLLTETEKKRLLRSAAVDRCFNMNRMMVEAQVTPLDLDAINGNGTSNDAKFDPVQAANKSMLGVPPNPSSTASPALTTFNFDDPNMSNNNFAMLTPATSVLTDPSAQPIPFDLVPETFDFDIPMQWDNINSDFWSFPFQ